eukprot:GHVU01129297.1.p2 GENE.GHVU01129297.1~~GHVU01129297.1.p2  ORF type:complete len:102 (-),score=1.78 GHVU01129297.1:544-849(-)
MSPRCTDMCVLVAHAHMSERDLNGKHAHLGCCCPSVDSGLLGIYLCLCSAYVCRAGGLSSQPVVVFGILLACLCAHITSYKMKMMMMMTMWNDKYLFGLQR